MPSPPTAQDMRGITWAGRYVFRAGRVAPILHAELERAIGGIRPDVLATDDEGPLLLEVRVTHRVHRAKREIVQARRYRMVEIDLSRVTFEEANDSTRFSHLVVHEPTNRHWISLPEAEDDWRSASAELEAQVASANALAGDEPTSAASVPAFVPDDPLRMPHPVETHLSSQHSTLRTTPIGSRLWHSGYGIGTVVRQRLPNAPVYAVDFHSYGELTIVLDASGDGTSWKVLAPDEVW